MQFSLYLSGSAEAMSTHVDVWCKDGLDGREEWVDNNNLGVVNDSAERGVF